MDFFGLDIGSQNIKLAQLAKSGDKYNLIALGFSPAPKSIESEAESDQIAIAEAVKKLLKAAKIGTKNVSCALPEDKVFTRIVELPKMDDNELKSAIRWEAEEYIPIPLSEAVLDYKVIDQPKNNQKDKVKIFLAASPRNLINKYIKICELADLNLQTLETEMTALSRSLIGAVSGPTLLIDMGARSTDVALIEDNQIVLTRSISSAGIALTRALTSSLDLKPAQAEEYKKAYGIDKTKLEGKIEGAIEPILGAILEEIEKAISFAKGKGDIEKVERVILTGGTADLPYLVRFLAEKLRIEVELGDPFRQINNTAEVMPQLEKGANLLYAVSFGLAMKEL